jgi:hypothetical protein
LDETATNPETRVQPCSFASGAVLSVFSCWYVNAQIGLGSAIAAAAAAAAQARADAQRNGHSPKTSHECTLADLASDLWNLFKKKALFDNPIQIDYSAEIVWGWNDFDRMAFNIGVNTLGQVILTGEDARNMQGEGAITAGSVGWNAGISNGPAASGAYIVHHREVAGAFGYRGFSAAATTSPGSGSATTPEPHVGGRGRIANMFRGLRPIGAGLAYFEGEQTQYISASDPLFDTPSFSGNCP